MAAAVGGGALLTRPAIATGPDQVGVLPRSAWAGDVPEPAGIVDEPDVRFLLVHHTVNENTYAPDDVPRLLRLIHDFHTGPRKGWPDIAYNFIVDRFGRAWETRAGSLDRPVAGDATGGSQGFDQKCAFLGDHRTETPTEEAVATMAGLLAFLADRSGVDTRPGATTSFESRGSNLHRAGVVVTTPTIAGHRSMSQTACPGDAGFAVVRDRLPTDATARRTALSPPAPEPSTVPTSSTSTATPPTSTATPTPPPPLTSSAPVPPSTSPATSPATSTSADLAMSSERGDPVEWPVLGAAGGALAAVVGGLLVLRNRRTDR